MNDCVQPLIQALQMELEEHGGLLYLFEQQRACVLRHDSAQYLHLNELLEEQLATLARCRAVRQGLAGAVARAHGRGPETPLKELAGSLPPLQQPLLHALIDEITHVVERARRRAEQNQLLLARCIETGRGVLSALQPLASETYSHRGRPQRLRENRMASAVA